MPQYTYATPTFINKAPYLANIKMRKKEMTLTALAQPGNLVMCFKCKSLPTNNETCLLTFTQTTLVKQKTMDQVFDNQELLVLKFLDIIPDN